MIIDFAFPGDINAPTGGYGYDRRVIAELRALGHDVRAVSLPASFPFPSSEDLEETESSLVATGDSCPLSREAGEDKGGSDAASRALIIDGLAFAVLPPDLVARLRPIALCHHPLFLEAGRTPDEAALLRAKEQAATDAAAAVVTTSRMTADIVAREFGVAKERLFVAEPGVEPAPRATGGGECVNLFSVGSVIPRKAYEDLVRALAEVPGDWRLTVAGSLDYAADYVAFIRNLIVESGVADRVTLAGALSAAEMAAAYARADVFVTPSHFEGFGMAIAEAVAHGLPVVATREVASAGAAPEAVVQTYPAGDAAALRQVLVALIGDAALRRRLSDAAWAAARTQGRWRDTAEAVLRALRFAAGAA